MTDGLLELYAGADRATRVRGRRWYPTTRKLLRALACEYGRPLSQVTAVFAITSPAAQLKQNLLWTEQVLQGKRKGGRYPNAQGVFVSSALGSLRPSHYVRGPKTKAFYRALMGNPNVIVLDRWALRAAGWQDDTRTPRITMQRQIEQAYLEAAQKAHERPSHFQAIVWLALRESTPKANGTVPKLWDVTHSEI